MSQENHIYLIHCLDDISTVEMVDQGPRFGGSAKRMSVYDQHKAYIAASNDPNSPTYIKKLAAGPMESEDLKYMIGSFFIVDATLEEVHRFNRNDPFYINNVWDKISITRYISFCGIKPAETIMENNQLQTIQLKSIE